MIHPRSALEQLARGHYWHKELAGTHVPLQLPLDAVLPQHFGIFAGQSGTHVTVFETQPDLHPNWESTSPQQC